MTSLCIYDIKNIVNVFYKQQDSLSQAERKNVEMLSVHRLTKRYEEFIAIQDISFCVKTGEIVGLIGHNGCGKSTTMNIITGYLAASEGTVLVDGEDHVERANSVRRKIGYLPETPALYPEMTVGEQLAFACELKGIKDKKSEIKRACQRADVQNVGGRLIRNLSKGYRQRIGLAQAFLGNPPLLVLDEPSSGLDPYQNAEMRDILKEASKEQAILLSSHVLSEVSAVCSRVVVLSNGRLMADDTPGGLRERLRRPGRFYVIGEGRMEEFRKAAQKSGWLSDIQVRSWERPGVFRAEFQAEKKDAAAKVFCILNETGVNLLQLGVDMPDLEESYFCLTKDQRHDSGDE